MRTTVTIDDNLYQQALDVADANMEKSELFKEAIKTFIRDRSAVLRVFCSNMGKLVVWYLLPYFIFTTFIFINC